MACKYIYEGVTYNSKEEFIIQVVNRQFLNNKSLAQPHELDTYEDPNGEIYGPDLLTQGEDMGVEDLPSQEEKQRRKSISKFYPGKSTLKEEQFLHLLARDNNWVTFFVKSIIQDSARKGYEKVLFPSGDTAAKVEGHGTLEDFIKNKQERLDDLNSKKYAIVDIREQLVSLFENEEQAKKTLDATNDIKGKGHTIKIASTYTKTEREQLEKEIADAKAGKLKISSIANFYETIIHNVLKKNGYSPTRTTDEYRNDWFEVNLVNTEYATQRILYGVEDIVNEDLDRDVVPLLEEIGLTEGSTPQDFIDKYMEEHTSVIAKMKQANPTVKIEFGEDDTQFDPVANKVMIDIVELGEVARRANIPLSQVVSTFILHELGHAATAYAFTKGKNDVKMQEFLGRAREYDKTNPFEDIMRQGYRDKDGIVYPLKSIDELAAEAWSNPYFQKWLQQVPSKTKKSLFQEILDYILEFFGLIEKPSLYDEIIDYVTSERIRKDNIEGSEHPSQDWDLEIVYRGTPKTYEQATFELFTSPTVQAHVEEVIKKLPSAVIGIKNQLDYETNKDTIKRLQTLIDAFNDVKENDNVIKVSINMLTKAGFMAQEMNKQLLEIPKLKDDAKKLTLAYSLFRNIEALEFIKPLAQDIVRIVEREGVTKATKPFVTTLKDITVVSDSVKRTFVDVAQPLILKQLTEFVGESEAEKAINERIRRLKEQRQGTQDSVTQGFIDKAIANEEANLRLIPNQTNFDLIFKGLYRDSSSSQMLFEAGMMNDHPIPSTVMKIIRQNNIAVSQAMLGVQNEHQVQLNKLLKQLGINQLRSTEKVYAPITVLVSRADSIAEDENGQPVIENGKPKFNYTTQRMLLSEYDPQYIKDATEKKAAIDYYFRKLGQADRQDDEQGVARYRQLLNQAYKARRDFFRENSEGRYKEPVLQMYDLLEKEIRKPDGTITTFGRERGYIFEDIEHAERRRAEETVQETLDLVQEEIQQLHIELRQLKSKYDDKGQEKTGFEKELADIANQYSELKTQYGTYELTEEGKAMFDKAKLTLDQQLNSGDISQEEYDRRFGEISVTELSEEYYNQVSYYLERIDNISQQLAAIPEFTSVFKGVNSERVKEGYAKIRELVKGFRDNEMTIDGQLFSKVRPELVKEIQAIQQEVEDLKGIAEKLKGLSIEESIRARELRGKKTRGELADEEAEELDAFTAKISESNKLYAQYKELIDEYSTLLEEFSELNDSSPSQYYQDELENQKAVFIAQKTEEVLKQIKGVTSLEEDRYIKLNNEWFEVERIEGTNKVVKPIEKKGFKTADEAVANKIARRTAAREVRKTQWWKDNHYQKYVWTGRGYEKRTSPIYIWVKTQPVDESYIKENQPSIKFKTYVVNPDMVNPDHALINDSIPVAKKDKYRSAAYEKLKNSTNPNDKAYFEYLEFARKSLKRAQEFIPQERRLGDILPSFVKTEDEVAVEFTNNIADRSMKVLQGEFALAAKASQDPDEQVLTGGSTSNFFAQQRTLPIRFSGRMDSTTQSADIAAMTLAYELAAIEYNKQSEDQPLLEAIRIFVENLPVQETKRLTSKLSLGNLFSSVKSRLITREKDTEKSNLSKTIDHILDTHVYGETKKSANITIRGMDFDLNKAATGLKKISSLSIFSLNAFVAVKNSISAIVQSNINSNIGQGFFTKSQYNKAHAEAVRHVKDYLTDYRKFGDKTKIGQELDFFQVLQGAGYNEYGQKTAWTALKNKANFLTSLKNASEFELQVAQYLAMSKANPVQLADGTWVEMRKAFEIKNGTLTPVAGAKVTQKQIESFIFKLGYVNRVINGAYRAEEKNAIQKNIFGDLVFYLNGYVVPGIVNRFGKTRYSAEADMITRGYINQTVGFIGDLVKYRTEIKKRWSVMSADEKHRVLRGTKELLTILGMAALVAVMGAGADKKELQQSPAIQNWALSLALAVKAETETFVPLPGMGLNDMARKMNSPFAAVRQVSLMIKTLQNLMALAVDQTGIANIDSAYYKTTSLRDGFHDKGDAKAVANLLKLIGWSGIGFDPVQKVLQQQNIQTLR